MTRLILPACTLLAAAVFATGWPIPPTNAVHPLGNNWGNYQNYGGGGYFHNGIDVITPDSSGAEVRAVRHGWVKGWGTIQAELHYRLAICDTSSDYTGRAEGWLYAHIDAARWHKNLGDEVQEGELIGYLVPWPLAATFDHCHFARISDTGATWMRFPGVTWWFIRNPLTIIRPNTDTRAPAFQDARSGARFAYCRDNVNNSYLAPTSLTGDVDIIARVHDLTGASTGNDTWDRLAPYELDYMIRRSDGRVIQPWTIGIQFSNTLNGSDVGVVYKTDNTCRSRGDYDRREYYYIVTNTDGDSIIEATDTQGKWATALVGDADYWVLVRASDVAGNTTTDSMLVHTANGVPVADRPHALLERQFDLRPVVGPGPRTISFNLLRPGRVQLRVLDQTGRQNRQLCDAHLGTGPHTYTLRPDAAGIYFIELTVPGVTRQARKTVVTRPPRTIR
ncbi:M23 family metallopeptidase [candidate division WOR-3 bacterium]|nr:M23 family metallopeptidase [candidate division WOR-3 bacterium]